MCAGDAESVVGEQQSRKGKGKGKEQKEHKDSSKDSCLLHWDTINLRFVTSARCVLTCVQNHRVQDVSEDNLKQKAKSMVAILNTKIMHLEDSLV
jgi:hypothetical protein